VDDADVLAHVDRVVRGGSMAALLAQVDAVHVLTSLTGFEALLRGREVVCHGVPFFAGWGLTRDLAPVPARRTRRLSLDALVAGTLILYPRYLDPVTRLPCPPEVLIARIAEAPRARAGLLVRLRRLQGKLMRRF
jgi:capsular polysaccharide export protein